MRDESFDFYGDIEQHLHDVGIPTEHSDGIDNEYVDPPDLDENPALDESETAPIGANTRQHDKDLESDMSVFENVGEEKDEDKPSLLEKIKDFFISVISLAGDVVRTFLFGDPTPDRDFWKETKQFVDAQNMKDHIRSADNKTENSVSERESSIEPDTHIENTNKPEEISQEDEQFTEVFEATGGEDVQNEGINVESSKVESKFVRALQSALKDDGFTLVKEDNAQLTLYKTPSDNKPIGEKYRLNIQDLLQEDSKISATSLAMALCRLNNQQSGTEDLELSALDRENITATYESLVVITCALAQSDMLDCSIHVSVPTSTGSLEGNVVHTQDNECAFCVDGNNKTIDFETLLSDTPSALAENFTDDLLKNPQRQTFTVSLSESQDLVANISYTRGDPHFTVDIVDAESGNVTPLLNAKSYLAVEGQGPSQNPKKSGNVEPTLNTFRRDLKNQLSQLTQEKVYSASAVALAVGAVVNPVHMSELKTSGKNQGNIWSLINESHDHIGFVKPDCGRLGVNFIGGVPCVTSNIPLELDSSDRLSIPVSATTVNDAVKILDKVSEQICSSQNENLSREQFLPCTEVGAQKAIVEVMEMNTCVINDDFLDLCDSLDRVKSPELCNPEIESQDFPIIPEESNSMKDIEMTQMQIDSEPELNIVQLLEQDFEPEH